VQPMQAGGAGAGWWSWCRLVELVQAGGVGAGWLMDPKGQEVRTEPKDGSTDGAGSVAEARKYRRQQDGDYGGL
jgi:hypothetical protein